MTPNLQIPPYTASPLHETFLEFEYMAWFRWYKNGNDRIYREGMDHEAHSLNERRDQYELPLFYLFDDRVSYPNISVFSNGMNDHFGCDALWKMIIITIYSVCCVICFGHTLFHWDRIIIIRILVVLHPADDLLWSALWSADGDTYRVDNIWAMRYLVDSIIGLCV